MGMTRAATHIDPSVSRGPRHDEGHAIAGGLPRERGHVLGDREAAQHPSAAQDRPHLTVGGMHIEPGPKLQRIGAKVARGIPGEIKR
jgi:hypothetical protein